MSRCGIDEGCDRPKGLSLHVTGTSFGEGYLGLVFDALNPCGVELRSGAVVADRFPLRTLATWSGCVGTDEPGARVLISGHVMRRIRPELTSGILTFLAPRDCEPGVASSQPRLKLKVTGCGEQGSTIIDVDSWVVMPAGKISIELIGPSDWALMGTLNVAGDEVIEDTWVNIKACPLDCCFCPPGVLTEWFQDSLAEEQTVLVRPRRAIDVAPCSSTDAAASAAVVLGGSIFWLNEPTIASIPTGGASWFAATNPAFIEVWGAAPYLFARSSSGNTDWVTLRWRIR